MRIKQVIPKKNYILHVVSENGISGDIDIKPFLDSEAFEPLKNLDEFKKVHNGGYFVEWECGADLSADTIEARWSQTKVPAEQSA